jgi:hypothetical protein
VIGEKRPYTDNELFIHPAHKILFNLPYNKEYQMLDTPISHKKYMRQLRKRIAFIKYGLEFTNPRYQETIVQAEYKWSGSVITGLFDGIETNGMIRRLSIECPQDIDIRIDIGGFGYSYERHAFHYRRGKHVIFLFSAPYKGEFLETISARYSGQDRWNGRIHL